MQLSTSTRRPLLILSVALLGGFSFATILPNQAQAQVTKTKEMPRTGASAKEKEKEKEKEKAKDPVDLNSATVEELETLPGVGPAYSRKIIDSRPHKTLADVEAAGVPVKTVEGLKGLAVIRPLPTPVDINNDPLERLETLPNVGPATAKEILSGRPFASYEDVAKLKGVGPAKLDALKGRLKFGKPTASSTPPPAPKTKAMPKAKSESPRTAESPKLAPGTRINLNTATQEELETLPGIGPVRSQQIIDARPFASIEDVMKIKGIKEVEFGKIKEHITVK